LGFKKDMKSKTKKVILLLVLPILVFLFLISFELFSPQEKVIGELYKLNATKETIDFVKTANCKSLTKYESYWIVNDCNNDVYFKLFLEDNGYFLGICTSWQTPREAILKLKKYVGGCIDVNAEDKNITQQYQKRMERYGLTKYLICGIEITFKGECIISWW